MALWLERYDAVERVGERLCGQRPVRPREVTLGPLEPDMLAHQARLRFVWGSAETPRTCEGVVHLQFLDHECSGVEAFGGAVSPRPRPSAPGWCLAYISVNRVERHRRVR